MLQPGVGGLKKRTVIQRNNHRPGSSAGRVGASKEISIVRDRGSAPGNRRASVHRERRVAWISCIIVDEVDFISHQAQAGFEANTETDDVPIRNNGISRQVINSALPEYIHNTDQYHKKLHPKMLEQGVRAAACLPLTYKDQVLGVLWLHYLEPHTFEISEQEALMLFANQAAIAYETLAACANWNIYAGRLRLLGAIGTQEVLEQIVKNAKVVLGADSTAIWSYDDVRDKFILDGCVAAGIAD